MAKSLPKTTAKSLLTTTAKSLPKTATKSLLLSKLSLSNNPQFFTKAALVYKGRFFFNKTLIYQIN
jgi:hypothetical protein